MKILKNAAAGTVESSDAYVTVEPLGEGISVEVESVVIEQFGEDIERCAREVLAELGVEGARLVINDRGALDCVIRARVETAVRRAGGDLS